MKGLAHLGFGSWVFLGLGFRRVASVVFRVFGFRGSFRAAVFLSDRRA